MSLPEDNPVDEQQPDRVEYAEAMAERYLQMYQEADWERGALKVQLALAEVKPTWTTDKPTAPGYYWHRNDRQTTPLVARVLDSGFVVWDWPGTSCEWEVAEFETPGSQWSRPILPPPEVPT